MVYSVQIYDSSSLESIVVSGRDKGQFLALNMNEYHHEACDDGEPLERMKVLGNPMMLSCCPAMKI